MERNLNQQISTNSFFNSNYLTIEDKNGIKKNILNKKKINLKKHIEEYEHMLKKQKTNKNIMKGLILKEERCKVILNVIKPLINLLNF